MTTISDLKTGEFFLYDGQVFSKGNGTIFMFNTAFVTCHSSYETIELPARTKVKRCERYDDIEIDDFDDDFDDFDEDDNWHNDDYQG